MATLIIHSGVHTYKKKDMKVKGTLGKKESWGRERGDKMIMTCAFSYELYVNIK